MSRPDFAPVIDAFRDLYSLFECSGCRFLLELIPRTHAAEVVKCRCGKVKLESPEQAKPKLMHPGSLPSGSLESWQHSTSLTHETIYNAGYRLPFNQR